MKKHIFILLLSLALPLSAFSQGGSNYSIFGIGDINYWLGAGYEGVGGTSIAFPSNYAINVHNPAMWSTVTTTRLQGGYRFNQNIVSDNANNSLYQNNGKVNGMLAIFSIDTALGASVSFGIYPYSNVNYFISTSSSTPVPGQTDPIVSNTHYQGLGGMSLAYIGGSIKILHNLAIGASIFTTFGYIQSIDSTQINRDQSFTSQNELLDNLKGWGLKGGLYYNITDNFSAGAFIESFQNLTVKRNHTTTLLNSYNPLLTQSPIIDTTFEEDIKLPPAYGIGVSYQTGKFLFGADFSLQDFSNYNYVNGSIANDKSKVEYHNMLQTSIGVSRLGARGYASNFLERINYNFGFGYRQLFYSVLPGGGAAAQPINEYYGTIGTEMPILSSSMLNFALTFGSRGTKDAGLVHEAFGRFTVDISLGEEWFKPFTR